METFFVASGLSRQFVIGKIGRPEAIAAVVAFVGRAAQSVTNEWISAVAAE